VNWHLYVVREIGTAAYKPGNMRENMRHAMQ